LMNVAGNVAELGNGLVSPVMVTYTVLCIAAYRQKAEA
jgi:hypothetical protein